MRVKLGDRMRCDQCGLQVMVTHSGTAKESLRPLRCSCGSPMKRFYEKPVVNKVRLSRETKTKESIRSPSS